MKGIYLTEQGKKDLEAKLTELELTNTGDEALDYEILGQMVILEEIISSAIILPIEESWYKLFPCSWNSINKQEIKNGVIISY
jgi:hypothetical protein